MKSLRVLDEASRQDLLAKSKRSIKGKQRFNKRNRSSFANSVSKYNNIDMNKLFRQDILTVEIAIKGETNNYTVRISFGGFCDILRGQLKRFGKDKIDLRMIIKALTIGFNKDDVYVWCSCPDQKYRFMYWASRNKYNSGTPQPSNGKWIRNPRDELGSACKHILLVLNNTSWIMKVAAVIYNYINYMEQHQQKLYADVIYPAIYGKKYEEPVQLALTDTDELETDTDIIDKSNKYAVDKTRFKKGNQQGYRFVSDKEQIDDDQMTLDDIPN